MHQSIVVANPEKLQGLAAEACLVLRHCFCLLLLKCVAHPWTLELRVKPQQGKSSLVINTQPRNQPGPNLT